MLNSTETPTLVTSVRVRNEDFKAFIDWQSKLNECIAKFPGFISLEIFSSAGELPPTWTLVQRFSDTKNFLGWRQAPEHDTLIAELRGIIGEDPHAIEEVELGVSTIKGGITEVFITEVDPEKAEDFRKWVAKIHQVEATFPGFRSMYVQAPVNSHARNWMTLLQFDSSQNLDRWLSSAERRKVLLESENLIATFVNHRLYSPYVGWFGSIEGRGQGPAAWKQTMLVLLVLFPIVMLELKYLPFFTGNFNAALSTFIGNAISVTLIAWPMMPIAIWFLGWWLSPTSEKRRQTDVLGAAILMLLYFLEIAFFWHLLS